MIHSRKDKNQRSADGSKGIKEQRERRKTQRLILGTAVLILAVGIAGGFAMHHASQEKAREAAQQREEERQEEKAREEHHPCLLRCVSLLPQEKYIPHKKDSSQPG